MVNSYKVMKSFATLLVLASFLSLSKPIGDSMLSNEHKEQILNAQKETVVKKVVEVDPKQLTCLAKNIFWESNGEPFQGQVAIARVVMNRIAHGFGKNPCNVIYQSAYVPVLNENGEEEKVKVCQFSWVCEGKGEPASHIRGYQTAKKIAYEVLAYNAYMDLIPTTALFFHATHVNPNWPYHRVATIGNHVFYSKSKPKAKPKQDSN